MKESRNAITGWAKVEGAQGFEALRAERQPGKPRKLTGEQPEEVRGVVAYGSRNKSQISEHVLSVYGAELFARQCQRIIQGSPRKRGSAIRPLR